MRVGTRLAFGSSVGVVLALGLCCLSFVLLSAQDRADVGATTEGVRTALAAGRYDEGERLASTGLARVEAASGSDSLEAARGSDLLVEALLKNGKAGAADSLRRAQGVVRLKEGLLGREAPELAVSLDNLGSVQTERGAFITAVSSHQRALAIRRKSRNPADSTIADTLDRLALPLILLQRFSEAERALAESQHIRDAETDRAPLSGARTLYLMALLHRYDGRYGLSTSPLEAALERQRRLLAPGHPDIAMTVQLRGELHFLEGRVEAAQRDWSAALRIEEESLRPGHPDIALTLRWLALAAKAFGDLTAARQYLERALPIGRASLGPCHQELPGLQNDFASLLMYEGAYTEAQKLYASALAQRQRCLGPNDQRTATVVHNQALLAAEMGDLPAADQLHRRAIRMWSAGLGPDHPYVARGLDALAAVVAARGQLREARSLYERALAIRQRRLGADHPDVAWTLTNIAQAAGSSGNIPLGLQRVTEAIEIYERAGAGDEPDHLARALALRGSLQARQGNVSAARASYGEALATRERIFGGAHPLAADARASVATIEFALQEDDVALTEALDAERIGRDHLRFTIRYLPERQALAYAAKRPRGLDLAVSITTTTGTADAAVVDALIRSRGVILDELAARAHAAATTNAELAPLNATVAATRTRFANLMLRSVEGADAVPRSVLDEARQQKETAERALAEKSVESRADEARARVGFEEVRRALPPGSVLVSFVRYDRTSFTPTANGPLARVIPSYAAFVTSIDGRLSVVPLGTTAAIDSRVDAWRREVDGRSLLSLPVAEAERAYRTAGTRLRQQIWDPLAGFIRGASHVFIVPDGALNLVSFAALPSGATRYVVETGPVIHLLSTERDLLQPAEPPGGRGLLAVGGAAYDSPEPSPGRRELRSVDCLRTGRLQFGDLPGTRSEIQDVVRLWSTGKAGRTTPVSQEVTMLTGRAASKSAVARASVGRRVLHLATHGFFLGTQCAATAANTRGIGGVVSSPRSQVVANSPLLVSGLAFAGANQAAARGRQVDGILTAEEVAGWNLQGTEWVVLSACDTGLGEIRPNEGVFGLRRAFQIAGVRTIIMSLWSVEDAATRAWMRALYAARFEDRLSTADAVHRADIRVLQARRAAGQSTHPFYWAAFVAAGDWR